MTQNTDYEARALAELAGADYFRSELAAALNTAPEDRDLVLIASYKAGVTYALQTAQVYATLATRQRQADRLREIEAAADLEGAEIAIHRLDGSVERAAVTA